MSRCQAVARPLAQHLRRQCLPMAIRPFTTGAARAADVQPDSQTQEAPKAGPLDLDPNTVLPAFEAPLIKSGLMPIGSQRRRVAIRTTGDVPFEQLPYQAFQEARKVLAADRQAKLDKLEVELAKIAKLEATDPKDLKGGQYMKDTKLASLRRYVEELKILADVNDPMVKKRFEDGLGDMNKPIYRYYAQKKWLSYQHRLIQQRISQFHIVPDLLPALAPTADIQLYFRTLKIPPGQIVDSATSETAPRLRVQVFDKGERLVSVVVVDADVPNVEDDGFVKRVHYMAANIKIDPTTTSLPLSRVSEGDQLAVPWLPAFSQKGANYHRLAILILEQPTSTPLDTAQLRELYAARTPFSVKSFRDKFALKPIGFTMFRSVWDENTAAVMARHAIPGAEVEFRPTRVYSLKEPKKARGWEAKRQGPKYKHLWKYTKRIKGLSNARGWTKTR